MDCADNQRRWPVAIASRRHATAIAGRQQQAFDALAELNTLAETRCVTSYGTALVHAGLGNRDAAFAALKRAFEERSTWMVWLRHDLGWKALRDDPRTASSSRGSGSRPTLRWPTRPSESSGSQMRNSPLASLSFAA